MRIPWLTVLLLFLLGGLPVAAAPASGARPAPVPAGRYPVVRIAAVVNDDVISVADLESRIRMAMLSTSIPDTPLARQRLAAQVLRTLIDEKLQMQEAKRKNIVATPAEINKAIASIEQQNNMKPGQLDAVLAANGIERSALVDQVKASIVWAKLVRQIATDTDPVSDAEIDETLNRLKRDANEPESRVAEIFLAVDNPTQDDEVHTLADHLIEQMKQGARFSAVAQQFSQSPTAAVGGDLGWIHPDELSPALAKAVAQMQPGELSPPIRTAGGYYLLLVLDRRAPGHATSEEDTVLHIAQVVFPLTPQSDDAARRAAYAEAQSVRSEAKTCDDMMQIGKQKGSPLSSQGDLRLSQIAPAMRSTVMALGIGQPSQPILQRNGVGVIMVCSKASPKPTIPTRDDVADTLMRQRLDMLARRYMEDLRRAAYVDVRV
ncbi:MAG TPA: peptidylprolyl isomerase [Stellaceae bacterium]|nr:peptidylprolyl isomerase [Stellaceae bacterium]